MFFFLYIYIYIYMGVAFKIQVPPVFIHFTFGVSIKKKGKTSNNWATPSHQETTISVLTTTTINHHYIPLNHIIHHCYSRFIPTSRPCTIIHHFRLFITTSTYYDYIMTIVTIESWQFHPRNLRGLGVLLPPMLWHLKKTQRTVRPS